MFHAFKKYLADKVTLSESDYLEIEKVSTVRRVLKRHYLLQEGDVWKYSAFVCDGFLRTYFVDDKGQEHTMNFSPENYWAGDRESLLTGAPSRYNIAALEDSHVLLIEKDDFNNLCKNIPVFNSLISTILERSFVVSQQRIHANITYSAEEKYHYFLTKYPSIANRVPQHMVASYLGISPETLSRVRKGKY